MPNRRSLRIISPGLQWKYAALTSLTIFITSASASVFLFASLHQQARERMMNPESADPSVTYSILAFALGWSAVGAGLFSLISLVCTHRLCGPIILLQRYFADLCQGRLPQVRDLRKKDEFKELMADFAGVVDTIRTDRRRILALAEDAVHLAMENPRPLKEDHEPLKQLLTRLNDERQRMQDGPCESTRESNATRAVQVATA